jgi:hypothetical protein
VLRRLRSVKFSVPALILLAAIRATVAFCQAPSDEPTGHEIEGAYRSKAGGGGWFTWRERWRVKEIRGWTVRFSHERHDKYVGVQIAKYHAVAKKNGVCAEYQITDTMIFTLPNPQMKPMLVVEPTGVKACR